MIPKHPKKISDIIEAIRHKSLLGSLPAFSSLDTWAGLACVIESSLRAAYGREIEIRSRSSFPTVPACSLSFYRFIR